MISFACSHCRQKLKAAEDQAGKNTKCPRCSQITPIPQPVASAGDRTSALPPSAATELDTLPPPQAIANQATRMPGTTLPQGKTSGGTVEVPGYEVLGELGRGGMGVVYKARQLRPRRLVALKMILAGEHAGTEALARFRSEAEAVARLSHANIVAVHEVGEHDGRAFLTLEYVEGGTLAQHLRDHQLRFREAAELVASLARAVGFAHKRGIIHRDLKPANVLLQGDERGNEEEAEGKTARLAFTPKITDFGLAKQLDGASSMVAGARTQSGAILGTPAYMAPEQAGGKSKKIGPPADVYALGAILYECLTGRPPFQADTTLDLILKVATAEPAPPCQVRARCPRDLETICLKCLKKAPDERYASAGELADDLRRYLDGEPILARPPGAFERLGRSLKRRKELAYLAGGACVALCAVALGLLLFSPWKKESGTLDNAPPKPQAPQEEDSASMVQEAARRMTSANNLKQLMVAMHNMASANLTLPSAAIPDRRTGQPLLSWRVAILPYIEQDVLYKQFKLDERWDSPHNIKLLPRMPKTFVIPETKTREPHSTYYQVFVGPGTAFEPQGQKAPFGLKGLDLGNGFPDGTSNTILLAEAAEPVPWTKPADLVYEPGGPLPRLGGHFKAGFHVGMADGSALLVHRTVSEQTLRNAITRNDGNVLGSDWPDGTEQGKGPSGARVSGRVFYKGAPLPGGLITFHSTTAAGRTYSGASQLDGRYEIEALEPGEHTITITATGAVRIPAKYADSRKPQLRYPVRSGAQTFDIELKD